MCCVFFASHHYSHPSTSRKSSVRADSSSYERNELCGHKLRGRDSRRCCCSPSFLLFVQPTSEVLRRAPKRRHKQVVSSFGADGDGAVSLPKFLRFLGKEYGRGGKRGGGGGTGRGLAQRLRLILKKVRTSAEDFEDLSEEGTW